MTAANMFRTTLSGGLVLFLLGGCTWVKSWPGGQQDQSLTPEPQVKVVHTADASWIEPVNKPTAVARMVPETTQDNKDAMERLSNLEHQVSQMQNDMNTMMPVLSKLVSVQTDIQAMLARLDAAHPPGQSSATMTTPPGAGMPAPPPAQPMTQEPVPLQPPPSSSSATTPVGPGAMIDNIRVGEHADRTRIVLDSSDRVSFKQTVDAAAHTLTIDVQGGWKGADGAQETPKSPLLSSWQATPDGQGGTRIVMQLRKSANVLAATAIPAAGDKPARIMIDLAAS